MKRSLIVLLVSLMAFSASASIYFDLPSSNSSGDFNDPANWDKGYVPVDAGDEIKIGNQTNSVAIVDKVQLNYTTTKITTANGGHLRIVTGGFIGNGREIKIGDSGMTSKGFSQSEIGYLDLAGGTLDVAGSCKLEIGYKGTGDGRMIVTGGTMMSSGSDGRIYVGTAGASGAIGLVKVIGSAASLAVSGDLYVADQGSTSSSNAGIATMWFDVEAGGVSKLQVNHSNINEFGAGSAELVLTGSAAPAADIVLIENTGTDDVDGVFDSMNWQGAGSAAEGAYRVIGGNLYQLTYVYDAAVDGENNDIALVYIPEPATMLLLGLGGLLIRRKK